MWQRLSTFGRPHGSFQGSDQCRTLGAQFGLVPHGQFAKYFFAFRGKPQQDLTAVIPGTSNAKHMADNITAMRGRLPDPEQRKRMVAFVESL